MAGNLAWAALPAIDEVDVLDRFNGVPTLGIVKAGPRRTLFWRFAGYVDAYSAWLYVPISDDEFQRLCADDLEDYLSELVFCAPHSRSTCICVAHDNRVMFEREWLMPAGLSGQDVYCEAVRFIAEALRVALEHELPPTRREMMQEASNAVKQLVSC